MPDSFLNSDQIGILQAMDIQGWQSRVAPAACQPDGAPAAIDAPGSASADWDSLATAVAGCERCSLHASRRQTVFGVGSRNADWMIIGEAPGAEEDRRGEPFVGKAGQLLNEMLRAAGFARRDVYIANILKCRPPNNRDPRPEEVAACAAYLREQVEMVAPKLILAVGRIAAQNLLHREEPVGKLRGEVHRLDPLGVPVVVTYHPAYLLRSPAQKRKAWADLCLARRVADQSST
ncbi:MAG: uracil-DNA glycosylase [Gammaproteobacteria bacterium]|nr:uracil-DNA glycosylase [Gammaproteobacteria bacterium]